MPRRELLTSSERDQLLALPRDDGALLTHENGPQGLVILHIALLQVTATHVLSVIAVVLVILSFLPHSH